MENDELHTALLNSARLLIIVLSSCAKLRALPYPAKQPCSLALGSIYLGIYYLFTPLLNGNLSPKSWSSFVARAIGLDTASYVFI